MHIWLAHEYQWSHWRSPIEISVSKTCEFSASVLKGSNCKHISSNCKEIRAKLADFLVYCQLIQEDSLLSGGFRWLGWAARFWTTISSLEAGEQLSLEALCSASRCPSLAFCPHHQRMLWIFQLCLQFETQLRKRGLSADQASSLSIIYVSQIAEEEVYDRQENFQFERPANFRVTQDSRRKMQPKMGYCRQMIWAMECSPWRTSLVVLNLVFRSSLQRCAS